MNTKKRIFNLNQLYKSNILKEIINKFSPEVISVMGSYSRGEDIEDSDIDLLIISNDKEVRKKIDEFIKLYNNNNNDNNGHI